jgi:polyadenylate-binding protein
VGFKSISKAEEALTKLNYTKLGKKTLRISWFSREPINPRHSLNNNIFVKKFDLNTTHQEFHNYFAKFGNIISAKLEEDEDGEIKGYGFVLYDNEESAKQAITETNSTMWKGRRIYVGPFVKKRPKIESTFTTIYVKNIPKVFFDLIRLIQKKTLTRYFLNTGK